MCMKQTIMRRQNVKRGYIMGYKAVLFDMDGTLLDTLEDLRDRTNHVLRQMGYPERSMG